MCINWKVSKCCCFDLKTGSLLIAQVDLSLEVAGLFITLVKLLLSEQKFTIYIGIGIVLTIFTIISCVYLKRGIQEDNPTYFKSWILSKAIVLVIALIIIILFAITLVTSPPNEYDQYSMQQILFLEILLISAFGKDLF
ncbi:hypothetical protein ACFFRR_002883 [Megaselia abdita]